MCVVSHLFGPIESLHWKLASPLHVVSNQLLLIPKRLDFMRVKTSALYYFTTWVAYVDLQQSQHIPPLTCSVIVEENPYRVSKSKKPMSANSSKGVYYLIAKRLWLPH